MILLIVGLIALLVTSTAGFLPELKSYVDSRSRADRACKSHAETTVRHYEDIVTGNHELEELRVSCQAAMSNPFTAVLSVAEIRAVSQAIELRQRNDEELIHRETKLIHDTGDLSHTEVIRSLRDPAGQCGIAGNVILQKSPVPLIDHESAIAGFQIFAETNDKIAWTYHSSNEVSLP